MMCEGEDTSKPALELRKCGCCDKEEEMYGDYKKCSLCHQQSCSKEVRADADVICGLLCLILPYAAVTSLIVSNQRLADT
jgi:hypothetical protein